jgi:hypothetical protein
MGPEYVPATHEMVIMNDYLVMAKLSHGDRHRCGIRISSTVCWNIIYTVPERRVTRVCSKPNESIMGRKVS